MPSKFSTMKLIYEPASESPTPITLEVISSLVKTQMGIEQRRRVGGGIFNGRSLRTFTIKRWKLGQESELPCEFTASRVYFSDYGWVLIKWMAHIRELSGVGGYNSAQVI
jgi:hypothetical protein